MSNENDVLEDDLLPCPFCRQPIFADADRCHHCGDYISDADWRSNYSISSGRKWNRLIVIAVVLAILGMLLPYIFSLLTFL